MVKLLFCLLFCTTIITGSIVAQDTLPRIAVTDRFGKIIISWKNAYGAKINNINIQRSTDSVKRFTTIGSVLNPMNKDNGYVDTKPLTGKVFYRVFVAFDGGEYLFTRSHRPVIDTSREPVAEVVPEEKKEVAEEKKTPTSRPQGPPPFVPSKFVFTGKDNNVIINLPNAAQRKLSIKFFDQNDNQLFEIHAIKEPYLILEKVNFLHSGWFKYNLYDNDILLEKYKFFIPKDLRLK